MSRARLGIGFSIALIVSLAAWRPGGKSGAQPPAPSRLSPTDSTVLKSLHWRNVGPDRGGRSIAIAGVRGQPKVGYFGAAGGGLWKTTDGGEHWVNVTDGQIHSSSIGAVAVSETDPNIVFIGMGEGEIRGDIQPGDGVYKSTDAGKTWTHIGFSNSDAITHIRIHPTNPNIVFVSDFGKFGANSEERGIFKSTDGGKSWRKVLYKSPNAGGVDVEIDRTNPNVMYAALWEAYRKEWGMSSGGPASGMYKSTDGGENWTEITHATGLPAGIDGKIGISISPVDPNRVFALVENENGGLFRSDDAGATWTLVNNERRFRQRAFYYTHVFADTKNKDLVYVENVGTYRSKDGGKTFEQRQFARGDSHDMWIDPDDDNHVLHAADPGGDITFNALADVPTWSAVNYPTAQLYHIVATANIPFYVCGSQQDESEVCMTSAQPAGGGRGFGGGRGNQQANEFSPGGSEDGYIAPDPHDPDIFYSGTNANGGGFLTKLNRRTGEVTEVSPYPRMFSGEESAVLKERWQWTYPIIFSPVDGKTLYAGSQHVWKTTNGGHTWTKISPDLTRHDPKTMGPSGGPITRDMNGPEVYATVFSIAPSKRTTNVIWAGSDDGLIHVTKDGGTTWANVTPRDMPDFGRVSLIDAGAHDSATAYVAVKRFLLDDDAPYIFRTHDMGKTWTKIVNGITPNDFVHAVREDPTRKGLLYAGTEHGVYMSYDDGDHWQSLSLNLPDLPVWDLIVKDDNLAIATHGRSFYILDHIEPLRQYSEKLMAGTDPILFRPAPAIRGSNEPATIQYLLRQPAQVVRIDVLDSKGSVIRTYPDTANATQEGRGGGGGRGRGGFGAPTVPGKTAGMNTFAWDMRYAPAISFPGMILWGGSMTGPEAAPGNYTLRLTADGRSVTQSLVIMRNPFHEATDADLEAQTALGLAIRDKVNEANSAVIKIRDLKKQVADRLGKSSDSNLKLLGDSLTTKLSAVEEEIYQVRNQSGQDPLNFPIKLNNRLASLMGVVTRGDTRPTANAAPIFSDLKVELKVQTDHLQKIEDKDLAALNALLRKLGLEPISVPGKPIA